MPGTRLSGKVAFITGGASGIGLSIVETFLDEGASVFVVDYNASNISSSKTNLSQNFPEEKFVFAEGDAADEGTVKNLVEECATRFGALDIGILNAGVLPPAKTILEVDTEEYERVMRINAFGPFIGLKTISQKMIFLGTKGGSIISTCSAAGLRTGPDIAIYSMAKFAVRGLTIAAGHELAEFGIRVNAVCPGIVDTVLAGNLRDKERSILACPMKRFGGTEEIAKVFLFLASDEASFVTSSLYRVDGGLVNS